MTALTVALDWWLTTVLPQLPSLAGPVAAVAATLAAVGGAVATRTHALAPLRRAVLAWAAATGAEIEPSRHAAFRWVGRFRVRAVARAAENARGWQVVVEVTGPASLDGVRALPRWAAPNAIGDRALDAVAAVGAADLAALYARLPPAVRVRLGAFVTAGGWVRHGVVGVALREGASREAIEAAALEALVVAEALARPIGVEDVVARLTDDEPGIRVGAALALLERAEEGTAVPDEVWPWLLAAEHEEIRLRAALLRNDAPTLRTLLEAARPVRARAALTLAAAAPPGTADEALERALVTVLPLGDPEVAAALGRIGTGTALAALRRHVGPSPAGAAARWAVDAIEHRAAQQRGRVSLAGAPGGGLALADAGGAGSLSASREP